MVITAHKSAFFVISIAHNSGVLRIHIACKEGCCLSVIANQSPALDSQ